MSDDPYVVMPMANRDATIGFRGTYEEAVTYAVAMSRTEEGDFAYGVFYQQGDDFKLVGTAVRGNFKAKDDAF